MLNTPYISDLIAKGKLSKLRKGIAEPRREGIHSFEQSLFSLFKAGEI